MSSKHMRAAALLAIAVAIALMPISARPAAAQEMIDHFSVTFTPAGEAVSWTGTGYAAGRWFYYPNTQWWNVWFANPPLTPQATKTIHVEFDAMPLVAGPNNLTIVYNWSTPEWSAQGLTRPPVPTDVPDPLLEELFIRRSDPPFFSGSLIGPVHIVHEFQIEPYCPEWISLDVRGVNLRIDGGVMIHECHPGPTPCEPTPDRQSCQMANCPTLEEVCLPTKVLVNYAVVPPAYQILTCECMSPNECHTEVGPGTVIVCAGGCPAGQMCVMGVVDNGDGTLTYECHCESNDTGACCYQDRANMSCIIAAEADCTQLFAGQYMGPGTTCDDADGDGTADVCEPLLQFGACCSLVTPGACAVTDPGTCQQLNGLFMGIGTNCDDTNGNGQADICEFLQDENDYGDAPEGALAYPGSGIMGNFPTCLVAGPATFIRHANFGGTFSGFDFDPEGNGGFCPNFTPNSYDKDECFGDGDAGLLMPGAFTIQGAIGNEVVIQCPNSPGTALGPACTNAVWGVNVDIQISNLMPPGAPKAYVNVLFDWDQNGMWSGTSPCAVAAAPEHALVNFEVPNGYTGPISGVFPPPPSFLIGPQSGYVWARFTLTERPVPLGWTGDGTYEDGETEDYLLLVGGPATEDFGDAPDPPYPTLIGSNGAQHTVGNLFLGMLIDPEADGQPDATATGDDLSGMADEDGVAFNPLPLVPGQPGMLIVTLVAPVGGARLSGWVDFNGDGSWATAGDQIFVAQPLAAGINPLPFIVPLTATPNIVTFARFRLHTNPGGVPFVGAIPYGEVEDYQVPIGSRPLTPKWQQLPAFQSGFDAESDFWWNEPLPLSKWTQPPDPTLPGLHAHNYDIGMGMQSETLADDWECQGGLVSHLSWWGNYEVDATGSELRGAGIQSFRLSIHTCAPGPVLPWCVPMDPSLAMWNLPFVPGMETDSGLVNNEGSKIYFYKVNLPVEFPQQLGNYYWFDLSANAVNPLNPPLWRWQEARRAPAPPLGHAPAAEQSDLQPWRSIIWPPVPPQNLDRFSDMAFEVSSTTDPTLPPVNKIVADDFRSDGRPIKAVRWWGSYFDERYAPGPTIDPRRVVDGWFISFHPTDPSTIAVCPPGPAAVDWPSVLAVYFAPAEAVQITASAVTDCLQHPVYEYTVDLDRCCLLCAASDPRTGQTPAQIGAFEETSNLVYWLGIQAVTGVRWQADACSYEDHIATGHLPSDQTVNGEFWGWHTSRGVDTSYPSMEPACAGRILDMAPPMPYPADCWRFDVWTKQPWMCPNPMPPIPPVHMSFELYAEQCQLPGDVNQSGSLTLDDIPCFVDCLLGGMAPDCVCGCADMNQDAKVDGQDIQIFVNALLGL